MTSKERVLRQVAKKIGPLIAHSAREWCKNPIFIVGCARSGTTLTADLLGRHRDIAHFSEANEVWDPKGYPWVRSDLKRPPNWLDPITFNQMWWQEVSGSAYDQVIPAVFGLFQKLSGKSVFLNKSPMNTFKIPYILKIFPKARFIHIYRDGRAVIFSYMKKEYEKIKSHHEVYRRRGYDFHGEDLLRVMAKSWVDHIEEVEKQKEELELIKKGLIYELAYEDFCIDPGAALEGLYDFLQLDRQRWGINSLPAIGSRNYKFKEQLTTGQVEEVTGIMLGSLKKKGYIK